MLNQTPPPVQPPEKGVLFQCNHDCPVIKRNEAKAGAIIPDELGLSWKEELQKGREAGYKPLYFGGRCTEWSFNGANEASGNCFLKGGIERSY